MNLNENRQSDQQYRHDLEAMAELLLDIYMDRRFPPLEEADHLLTRPSRGRKIRLPHGVRLRREERSSTNDSSNT